MIAPSLPVLVAISGGSDSTALLLRLRAEFGTGNLSAATVDHGLRAEAADEARWVEALCAELGIPHATLRWIDGQKAAASARVARYDLLLEHARIVGANTIALGHTKDDQAETVFMRAMRLRSESNTRGLSGMSAYTHHQGMTLWRPLLGETRAALRAELIAKDRNWIDDPSNVDPHSERVRVRNDLRKDGELIARLDRFATACSRSRIWLGEQTAAAITGHVESSKNGEEWHVLEVANLPALILREILSVLIMLVGGASYRPALGKLAPIMEAAANGQRLRHAVGRTVVKMRGDTISILPEGPRRNEPASKSRDAITENALDSFRSTADEPIAKALQSAASKSG